MIEVVASSNGGWKFMRRTSAGSLPMRPRERVDEPLDDVGGLGPAGTAVGIGGRAFVTMPRNSYQYASGLYGPM